MNHVTWLLAIHLSDSSKILLIKILKVYCDFSSASGVAGFAGAVASNPIDVVKVG